MILCPGRLRGGLEASRGISRNCYTSTDSNCNGVLENDMLSRCGVMFDHYTSTDSSGNGVIENEVRRRRRKDDGKKENQNKMKITMHRLILVLAGSPKLIFSPGAG